MRSHYLIAFSASIIVSLLDAGFLLRTPIWRKFISPERDCFVQVSGSSLNPACLRAPAGPPKAPAPPSLGTLRSLVLAVPLGCVPTLTTHSVLMLAQIHGHVVCPCLSARASAQGALLVDRLPTCGWDLPCLVLLFALVWLVSGKRRNAGFMLSSLNLKPYCSYTKLY